MVLQSKRHLFKSILFGQYNSNKIDGFLFHTQQYVTHFWAIDSQFCMKVQMECSTNFKKYKNMRVIMESKLF